MNHDPSDFHSLEEFQFLDVFAAYFDLEGLTMQSRLVEDLGFDSIAYLEVAVLLGEVSESVIEDALIESFTTLGDVFFYYNTFCENRSRQVLD